MLFTGFSNSTKIILRIIQTKIVPLYLGKTKVHCYISVKIIYVLPVSSKCK